MHNLNPEVYKEILLFAFKTWVVSFNLCPVKAATLICSYTYQWLIPRV